MDLCYRYCYCYCYRYRDHCCGQAERIPCLEDLRTILCSSLEDVCFLILEDRLVRRPPCSSLEDVSFLILEDRDHLAVLYCQSAIYYDLVDHPSWSDPVDHTRLSSIDQDSYRQSMIRHTARTLEMM